MTVTNLNQCARKKDSPFSFGTHEGLVRLVPRIFESVAFVEKDKSDLTLLQDRGVQAERFVDGEFDLAAQPLMDLVVPVLRQSARCDDDGLVNQLLAVEALSKKTY